MPKVICTCGNIIGLSDIPSPNKWLIISDEEYDNIAEDIDSVEFYLRMKIVVKCHSCKRLHIFWDEFDTIPTTYIEGK